MIAFGSEPVKSGRLIFRKLTSSLILSRLSGDEDYRLSDLFNPTNGVESVSKHFLARSRMLRVADGVRRSMWFLGLSHRLEHLS